MLRARRIIRVVAAFAAVAMLLLPGLLTAIAWSPINLGIALLAVTICIAVGRWAPSGWKWFTAVVASLLIAVPPYPNWLWVSEERGWHLHIGARLESLEIAPFAALFVIALVLFWVLYWAIGKQKNTHN